MLELFVLRFSKFTPTTGHRVCGAHFEGGKKTYMNRVPTIFPLRPQKVERRRPLIRTQPELPNSPTVAPQHDTEVSGSAITSSSSDSEDTAQQSTLLMDHAYSSQESSYDQLAKKVACQNNIITELAEKAEAAYAHVEELNRQLKRSQQDHAEAKKLCDRLQQKNRCLRLELSCMQKKVKRCKAEATQKIDITYEALGIVIKLNKRYKMKVVQAYAPTSSHDDASVESFYEDVESAMSKVKTQYTIVMGDFNAKVGKKQAGDQAVGDYGIGTRNARGELLVEFAERNNLRILNTFYRKRENRKWTWRSPNGENKNEIDFIMSAHPGIVQDVEADDDDDEALVEDEKKLRYYTGFTSRKSFDSFWSLLEPDAKKLRFWQMKETENEDRNFILPLKTQLVLVLMRLRLGLDGLDLAYRFGVSTSTVSRIWVTWLDFLDNRLRQVPTWMPPHLCDKYRPQAFTDKGYTTVDGILDCTEIFIETPSSFRVQSETYSSYKKHNTAKGLVVCSSNGFVMFVSDLSPGRLSDKALTKASGVLEKFSPGRSLMADRGFTIEEECKELSLHLNIPPFMEGRPQLSEADETETRLIASVRIHVEKVIRRIKTYIILSQVFPNSMSGQLNKVWHVCARLTNFVGEPLL
ncbi:uncharacterized protein LOC119178011 [Rhipicephalus microplus]|uniref:uncharacterized protein LOC119178011 n=1 Tax=Rhipicephalus microplus TaxID=6941 RepID=UPI003F6B031D